MVQVDSRWTLENHLESSGVHLNSVRECKVLNSLCSSITESHHITAVKKPWCRFNCYEALGKMLITNQWLDKLTAARNNFIVCGMLPLELCLLDFYAHFWMINLVEAMAPSWTWICQIRMMIFWNTYLSSPSFILPFPLFMPQVTLLAYVAYIGNVFNQLHHGKALACDMIVYLWWRMKIKRDPRIWVLSVLSYFFPFTYEGNEYPYALVE